MTPSNGVTRTDATGRDAEALQARSRPYTQGVAKKPSKSNAFREPDEGDLAGKDPVDVLRRALALSSEDAEKVREDAAEKAKNGKQGR